MQRLIWIYTIAFGLSVPIFGIITLYYMICHIQINSNVRKWVNVMRYPVSILYKSIAGRYRPVRVADGPITARCRFIKNASWVLEQGPSVKLASCKSALTPPRPRPRWFALPTVLSGGPGVSLTLCCFVVYSTRRFVVCLSVCHFVLVFFSFLLVLRLPRLGKRELILVLFVRLFGLCLFKFVSFLFLLGSGIGCGL